MKFASISLSNYIGIYNGMGLYDINIDMTRCKNRITIIRGDNGSGKSTLSKAMNLFPDSNDAFIPGMPARKEIVLIDKNTIYKLVFIHNVKQNGERDTTKAYITKTFDGNAVELNENGNVSSFKDILYSELGLDANFAALSQLSNDDRGLADKKPAERKKFVNSIISSLDTYNSIYKTLSKRSSNYKSMINAIVAKLNILGDEKSLINNLESIEGRINIVQDNKDKSVEKLAKENSIIQILDPDGSIQNSNTIVNAELANAEKDLESMQSIIDRLVESKNIKYSSETALKKDYESLKYKKNSLIILNQASKNNIEMMMQQKESEAADLDEKIQRLNTLKSEYSFDILKEKMEECRVKLDSIQEELKQKVGILDVSSISREEYILALETLKDLESHISVFKSCTDFTIIESIINDYISLGRIPDRNDSGLEMSKELESIDERLVNVNNEIISIQHDMELLDVLSKRPKECKIDTCSFISNALSFKNKNPEKILKDLTEERNSLESLKENIKNMISHNNDYNDALNLFSIIIREIDKNGTILSKMPNGDMFTNKPIFFERLMNGYSFEYMKDIYKYIDLANLFDIYKSTKSLYDEYISEYKVYESKSELIDSISKDIDNINKAISSIADKIEPIHQEILENDIKISEMEDLESVYSTIIAKIEEQKPVVDTINNCKSKLLENSRKMNDINAAIARATTAREEVQQYSYELEPLMKERDKINHSVQMMKDYIRERDELQANYDFIETIKYYSSPTTGIQLVFMELYMGKIIALANELLGLLFKGQFVIQPFVINESEFRIPCLGSGYLNDDISSMSSAQISMISMILSFALLHHSSTNYNIIKLDEIDGPLDYNNRLFFIDVLNKIMDIMGTEQCIMISHNSELQVDNSDVILLKHDTDNTEYMRGNIIWSY